MSHLALGRGCQRKTSELKNFWIHYVGSGTDVVQAVAAVPSVEVKQNGEKCQKSDSQLILND